MTDYNLYSEFNPDKHKENYTHYLEVIIDADEKIMYAVPSHQEKMIQLCCEKLNCTREQLNAICPQEYYFDFLTWLSMICGAVAVWEKMTMGYEYTKAQIESLKMLKSKELYLGEIGVLKMREKINTKYEKSDCFEPEKDNPYPLCVGKEKEECNTCSLWADLQSPYDE